MGKYIVTSGQNIYDVALHLYGSIEGIVDLLMNNTELSFATDLKSGDELIFTDGYIINADTVSYNRIHKIVPSNGERSVYYKEASWPLLMEFILSKFETSTDFTASGTGKVEIDWGDNSLLETVTLSEEVRHINHSFDNLVSKHRKIRIYGEALFSQLDFTMLKANAIYLHKPVYVEKFILTDTAIKIGFLSLLDGIYDLDLSGHNTDNLLELLDCKKLMRLNLSYLDAAQSVIDNYLISLVKYYYGRRSCTITLTARPSGEYNEPARDQKHNYILTTGMEAVWLLSNEPAWNEGGFWKFIIDNETYSSEK
ncbi:hypothetical protein [Dysgonomonas sp. GY617]|uniref:hypothetical protein n=1 Tax=Dysgonomonas sp. GY617 TaxID=2780420 RepID=UPI001883B5C1|nr:hypothetical protein [Dysgonomonas sp. GY617]MBF0575543.1 hypothetical protein [Dysgonomonas sp. GY617]